ncbi:hypothetical protein KTE60_22580 [Burkholderia multivorans]|uniref:hypothetical protein n=1 Tax=Burkholderia multivorans TaxID=87883 RepID=UPI001C24689E|nr:hypothetical protein [Burkholderia multivorans]MBU9632073.1 hypothetical protein [Burkholderia multivorans]
MSQYPFLSVHKALESTYNTLAVCGVKCPAYGVPTSASTVTEKVSLTDRLAQAVWIAKAVGEALSPHHSAWVTCTYDGAGAARDASLDFLAGFFDKVHKNAALVRAVVKREFEFGETYCRSLEDIAGEAGVGKTTVFRVAKRIQDEVSALRRETVDMLRPVLQARGWLPPQAGAIKK